MKEIDPQTKAFGFVNSDAQELYNQVLVLLDTEFQNSLIQVMNPKVQGEERAHYAGAASAYNDALRLFQANREFMLKVRYPDEKQSNANQSGGSM